MQEKLPSYVKKEGFRNFVRTRHKNDVEFWQNSKIGGPGHGPLSVTRSPQRVCLVPGCMQVVTPKPVLVDSPYYMY